MALLQILLQYGFDLEEKSMVDILQTLAYIFMYGGLGDLEHGGRLANRGVMLNDIVAQFSCPFITFVKQIKPRPFLLIYMRKDGGL